MKSVSTVVFLIILIFSCVSCASLFDFINLNYLNINFATPVAEWFQTGSAEQTKAVSEDTGEPYPTYTFLPTYTLYPTYTPPVSSADEEDIESSDSESEKEATATSTKKTKSTSTKIVVKTKAPVTPCPQIYINTPCP